MSTLEDLQNLIDRMQRLAGKDLNVPGQGERWRAELPDGSIQTYQVSGMRSLHEIEDEVLSLAVWVWSAKDHFKEVVRSKGGSPKAIEEFIDQSPDLQICSDIANTLKHATIDRSRSGRFLRAGRLKAEIPQSALGSLTLLEAEVHIDVSKPELVKFNYPLLDSSGAVVGDVIDVLKSGISAWERYYSELNGPA